MTMRPFALPLALAITLALPLALTGCDSLTSTPDPEKSEHEAQHRDGRDRTVPPGARAPWADDPHTGEQTGEHTAEGDTPDDTRDAHVAGDPTGDPIPTTPGSKIPASPSPNAAPAPVHPIPHPSAPASFADLVERVQPAVVNIYTEQVVPRRQVAIDPIYGPYAVTRPYRATSLGSGFIVDEEGYILTNTHVINDAQTIKISTSDGREMPATVIGTDPMTDVALIRIEPFAGMRYLELGDANAVRVGDWLMAVGNPFGLQSTVTVGILSARGRRNVPLGGDIRYVDFLQTDASINPGNSGGPLIAMDGTVVGINTAINAEGQGIGFAVPINMARSILEDLRNTGSVSRAWLGVRLGPLPVDPQEGRRPEGALVHDLVVQGPAALAGMQRGDVIVAFGEHPIKSHDDLPWLASNAGVGEEVDVQVRRGEQTLTLPVTMGALPY